MKFGKRLTSEASRRWDTHFLDYKACKKAVQRDVFAADAEGHEFLRVLKQELAKVSAFFSAQEDELEALLPQPDLATPAEMDAYNLRITELRKYVVLNYVACIKAVKKRNRHMAKCGPAAGNLHATALLSRQPFFTSPRLAALQTQAEVLAQGMDGVGQRQAAAYECPICLGWLHMPVVLTCAHRFCWACLLSHCASSMAPPTESQSDGKGEKVQQQHRAEPEAGPAMYGCPVCRKDHILDLDRLQVDPHLHTYVENLKQQEAEAESTSSMTEQHQHQHQHQHQQQQPKQQQRAVEACSVLLHPAASVSSAAATAAPKGGAVSAAVEQEASSGSAVALPAPSSHPKPLLPPQAEKLRGRMTVVLDLDGTLISSFTPSRAPRLPSGMVSYVVGRGQKLNPGGVFVIERPGLQAFLERLNEFAEVVLFTAGLEDYAQPILDKLQQRYTCFHARLYRTATSASRSYPCIKDLSRLGRDLSRTLLVDDTPLAFVRQPHNGLPVLTFRGDVDDRVLMEALLPVLESLNEGGDVRPTLQRRFNMHRWFTAQGLHADEMGDVVALPVKQKTRPALPEPALPPRAPSAAKTLLLFDFDKTLTDWDAGERLVGELAPELLPMLASLEMPANFVPLTNAVLAEMARRGITRDQIMGVLHTMAQELPAATPRMLQWASKNACDVRVLSDCNAVVIGHVLKGSGLSVHVRQVITNEASFQRCSKGASSPPQQDEASGSSHKAQRRPASHALVVEPRRAYEEGDDHGCDLCPANMCKGAEVDSLLTEQQYRRVVYCGDGENDLCPALHLAPGDLVLARKGYGLHKLLTKRASLPGEQQCKATVRLWATHAELAELLRKHAV